MDKRRYILEPPEVKDFLLKGDRFTKWSEVRTPDGPPRKTKPVVLFLQYV